MLLTCALLAACSGRKADAPNPEAKATPAEPAKPATVPACAAKAKDLEPWLVQLEQEVSSHEIDFGLKLQPIDRAPYPVEQRIDYVSITDQCRALFEESEANHVGCSLDKLGGEDALVERLKAAHDQKGKGGVDDVLRLDVDGKAHWGDVARIVEAAAKAGYTNALFGFTATSKLAQPPGVDASTVTEETFDRASKRLDELQTACKPWKSAILGHRYVEPKGENARAVGQETAAALVACNCAADPDEVRRVQWIVGHWHQATPRVGVTVALGGDGTEIAVPAATPWSEAHQKILAAAPTDAAMPPRVRLAVK
jgi:hypothetical protein